MSDGPAGERGGAGRPQQRMGEAHKVVARYADTRVAKGFTEDFDPEKPRFHLRPPGSVPAAPKTIDVRELKALFFVRDFAGDPRYEERKRFDGAEWPVGRRVEVIFRDGEVLVGSTTTTSDRARTRQRSHARAW